MGIAKVTRNYQVTIPKDIRHIQQIKVGDMVLFAIEGVKVDFLKMEGESMLRQIAGTWKDKIKGSSVGSVRVMRKGWSKRTKRLGL